MYVGDRALATGSSFFWTRGARTFLITNWHNVSGYNHLTGELLSPTGAVPDRLGFRVFERVSEPDREGFFELQSVERRIDLFDSLSRPGMSIRPWAIASTWWQSTSHLML
jgi:hypothetical protein